eukprot:10564320-Lingulodinium_polyedra.AAC.1
MAGVAEGRVQYAVAHAGGARALHVIQVYGESEGARSADSNLAIVSEAIAWLRSLGDVPAVLVGDFNMSLDDSGMEGALAMAGWADLLRDAGPTCFPS